MNFNAPLKRDPLKLLIKEHFISAPATVVLKKTVADRIQWDTRYLYAQDFDYWVHCALHANFAVLSDVLVYKRTHKSNFSNDEFGMWSDHALVLKNLRDELGKHIVSPEVRKAIQHSLADTEYRLGNTLFEGGRSKEAFARYRAALSMEHSPDNVLRFVFTNAKKGTRLLLREWAHER